MWMWTIWSFLWFRHRRAPPTGVISISKWLITNIVIPIYKDKMVSQLSYLYNPHTRKNGLYIEVGPASIQSGPVITWTHLTLDCEKHDWLLLLNDIPYLALTSELWSCLSYFAENRPCLAKSSMFSKVCCDFSQILSNLVMKTVLDTVHSWYIAVNGVQGINWECGWAEMT